MSTIQYTTFTILALAAAASAQTIQVYGTTDCSDTIVTAYNCNDYYESCAGEGLNINSFMIVDDGGSDCNGQIYNSWSLFSNAQCDSYQFDLHKGVVGGGGSDGCSVGGCIATAGFYPGDVSSASSLTCFESA